MSVAQLARQAGRPGVFRLSPVAACLMAPALAWGQYAPAPPKFDSYGDFGGVGLLQMPTARFAPEGTLALNVSYVDPYLRTSVNFQALPWLEGAIRYSDVGNRLYGPQSFSGSQSFKDKGVDFKIRLQEESRLSPQIALGMRDIGGTGLFSSEYLVLNKRFYNFDFSLGIGWGYLGNRGHLKNPLGFISDRFKSRPAPTPDVSQAGKLATATPFSGERVALFGGISYQTPIPGLVFKLEYDGNDYQNEPLNNKQEVRSPFNVGVTYAWGDWLDLSVGYERGNQWMAKFTLKGDIHRGRGMPKSDPPPEALKPRDLRAEVADYRQRNSELASKETIRRLSDSLAPLDFRIESLEFRNKEMVAAISQPTFRNRAKAIGRATRAMANAAPADIELLTVVDRQGGLDTQRISLLRKDLEKAVSHEGSPEEMARNLRVQPPYARPEEYQPTENPDLYPKFDWGWAPAMRHHIGGPDDPYFYQIYLRAWADLQVTRKFSLSAEIGADLTNNFDKLRLASNSVLPHVRSDIKDYLKEGRNGVTLLQMDYLTNLGPETWARFSAGLFEDMFGGVGGEILYQPFGKRWAIGADLYRVRQRDYDKRFSFRDYEVTTGHVDLYYKMPFYNITAQLSVGQYLAGDRGATISFTRRFDSGAEVGVFATKTNVSAKDFGEGSFDKGAFVSIPFDFLSLFSNRSFFGIGWRPLTRDGGQRLIQSKRLYPLVSGTGREPLLRDWQEVLD